MGSTRKLWLGLAALLIVSFGVLLWAGGEIFRAAPPIPERVTSESGQVVYTRADIEKGRQVWQSMGGMQLGSIWGHGGYVAPDWSADWLHREAVQMLDAWAREEDAPSYDALPLERQAALRGRLQEARWLLKSLEARGDTLLKVMRCLLRQQSAFLEFGDQALRPLTLREVAGEVGLHESTISRAIARKYVRTPRGTIPLRAFFASGIETGSGGEPSSTAIQAMIRRLIDDENPRKPLSDAKLADLLKQAGIPVARRTVAKYREAMNISASHERVRIG